MKKISGLFLILFLIPNLVFSQEAKKKVLYFYKNQDCLHCQRVEEFFSESQAYEHYEIKKIEASGYYNLDYLNSFFDAFQVEKEKRGWPVVIFGNKMLLGDQPIIDNFEKELQASAAEEFPDPRQIREGNQEKSETEVFKEEKPLLGLVAGTAFLDSLNLCSWTTWVFLVALFVFSRKKPRVRWSGIVFSLTVFSVYFLLGFGNFGREEAFHFSRTLPFLLGFLAVFLGFLNLLGLLEQGKNFLSLFPILKRGKFSWGFSRMTWLREAGDWVNFFSLGLAGGFWLFPCADRLYLSLTSLLARKEPLGDFLFQLGAYNLIFILPLGIFSVLIFFFGQKRGVLTFLEKNLFLIDFIVGLFLILAGIYFITKAF